MKPTIEEKWEKELKKQFPDRDLRIDAFIRSLLLSQHTQDMNRVKEAIPKAKTTSVLKQIEVAKKYPNTYGLRDIRNIVKGWNAFSKEVLTKIGLKEE